MTKTVSANLQNHLAETTTTLTSCLHITRTDGTEFFFTTLDIDLTYDGDVYLAVGGYVTTSNQTSTGYSIDQLGLTAYLDAAGFTESDIIAGLFDFAKFEVFELDYTTIADGIINHRTGVFGEYAHGDPEVNVELRGLMQYLHQRIGRLAMRRCDANLGDSRCGVTLATYTVTGTVSASPTPTRQVFTVTSAPAAAEGLITFTSGNNSGLSMEIKSISGSEITLALPMPFDVAASDGYSAYRGCDKNISTCNTVFSNVANIRAFPHLPGNDEIFKYPDAR